MKLASTWSRAILLASHVIFSYAATDLCPIYGPLFPHPTNIANHPAFQPLKRGLDSGFPAQVENDPNMRADEFSYAVEVFSGSEGVLWDHYWTATNLREMNTTGVRKLDRDSVFRVGSVSKIFVILSVLVAGGDRIWNDPITKYVPELAAYASQYNGSNRIFKPDWDAITVGSLASQASGLQIDYSLLGEMTQQYYPEELTKLGFPPLRQEEIPPCGMWWTCSKQQFLEGLGKLAPVFTPYQTPTYSNAAFVLLSYVAESLSGKPYKTFLGDGILKPLGMEHTYYSRPANDSVGIIPGSDVWATGWAGDMGQEAPTGNMYVSTGDLTTFGRAILQSKLIRPAVTNRWLKPVMLTSEPLQMVGQPWGMRMVNLTKREPPPTESILAYPYQTTAALSKAGTMGKYSSLLMLLPELDLGFSIMIAGEKPNSLQVTIANNLLGSVIPTYMYVAGAQANATYGGIYASTDPALNSSLTVTLESFAGPKPGLGVTRWISNGTDMAKSAAKIKANVTDDAFALVAPSVRLYPTGLEDPVPGGGKRVAFRAMFEFEGANDVPLTVACYSWMGVSGVAYGSMPLDLFVFDVDGSGRVVSVENAALRASLKRQ